MAEYRARLPLGILCLVGPNPSSAAAAACRSNSALTCFAAARWGSQWRERQRCPRCGLVDSHPEFTRGWRWKCRATGCATQFTVFSDSALHAIKMAPETLLAILEDHAGRRSDTPLRELAQGYGVHPQTLHVLHLKIAAAIHGTLAGTPSTDAPVDSATVYFISDSVAVRMPHRRLHRLTLSAYRGPTDGYRYVIASQTSGDPADWAVLLATAPLGEMAQDRGAGRPAAECLSGLRAAAAAVWGRTSFERLEAHLAERLWRASVEHTVPAERSDDLLRILLTSPRCDRVSNYWNRRALTEQSTDVTGAGGTATEVAAHTVTLRGEHLLGARNGIGDA